jgi:hypothetical protein
MVAVPLPYQKATEIWYVDQEDFIILQQSKNRCMALSFILSTNAFELTLERFPAAAS